MNKNIKEKVKRKTSNKENGKELVMPKKSYALLYIFLSIGIILTVALAQYFTVSKVPDVILAKLNYFEKANIDYKVYYQENPFYQEAYIGKDKTYISQYVDEIEVDFDYYTNYSERIKGNYNFNVVATLKVFEPGNEENEYWAPKYELTDKETVDFINQDNYRVQKNVKIDFNKYLKEYNNYKSKSALASNAKLIVEMIVVNDGEYSGLNSIKREANLKVEIPLSEASFKINVSDSTKNEEQSFISFDSNAAERTFRMIIAGLCWLFAFVLGASFIIVYRNNASKESLYSRKLRKILNTYDSIIVNVEKLPNLRDLSVVNVTTFEELVDAQMEVRLPINFKEDTKKHEAKFVLMRNNLAWVYTLAEESLSEKD